MGPSPAPRRACIPLGRPMPWAFSRAGGQAGRVKRRSDTAALGCSGGQNVTPPKGRARQVEPLRRDLELLASDSRRLVPMYFSVALVWVFRVGSPRGGAPGLGRDAGRNLKCESRRADPPAFGGVAVGSYADAPQAPSKYSCLLPRTRDARPCRRRDSNPHGLSPRGLRGVRVYQFRHAGTERLRTLVWPKRRDATSHKCYRAAGITVRAPRVNHVMKFARGRLIWRG